MMLSTDNSRQVARADSLERDRCRCQEAESWVSAKKRKRSRFPSPIDAFMLTPSLSTTTKSHNTDASQLPDAVDYHALVGPVRSGSARSFVCEWHQ